jgi:hypothetical protein
MPNDPYNYVGQVYVLRQKANMEEDEKRRALLKAEALAVLEEGYEATLKSSIVANELAQQKRLLGSSEDAKSLLRTAMKQKPTDERLRDMLVLFEIESGNDKDAMRIAIEGAKLNPTSWRFQIHLARLKRRKKAATEAIKGHYQSALRNRKGDLFLLVEYGSFLFIEGLYTEARTIFEQAKFLPISGQEKRNILVWWKDDEGKDRVFGGRIKSIQGPGAWVQAVPDNFDVFFWRVHALGNLKQGDNVRFKVGFNALGPYAMILKM